MSRTFHCLPFRPCLCPVTHSCRSSPISNSSSESNLDILSPSHSRHSLICLYRCSSPLPRHTRRKAGTKDWPLLTTYLVSLLCFSPYVIRLPSRCDVHRMALTLPIEDRVISFTRRASRRGPLATVSRIMRIRTYTASRRMSASALLVPIPITVVA